MIWRSLVLTLLLIGMPAIASDRSETRLETVHVIYLNPALSTYAAVSRQNLVYNNPCIVSLPPKQAIDELQELIDAAAFGPFDDNLVRVKIDGVANGPIYLDKEGGAFIEGDGISKKMSTAQWRRAVSLLKPIQRPAGVNCSGRWPSA